MKERPILFSAPMVRAILEGRKTQTRRIGKHQMDDATELGVGYIGHATKGEVAQATYRAFPKGGSARWAICECPYGIPGDRLWVRETHRNNGENVVFAAGGELQVVPMELSAGMMPESETWRPSIFLPRWASRITLEITDLRVERVQAISHEDARAEGVLSNGRSLDDGNLRYLHYGKHRDIFTILSARESYLYLWDSINGKKHPWVSNPWVWVIEFQRIKP